MCIYFASIALLGYCLFLLCFTYFWPYLVIFDCVYLPFTFVADLFDLFLIWPFNLNCPITIAIFFYLIIAGGDYLLLLVISGLL